MKRSFTFICLFGILMFTAVAAFSTVMFSNGKERVKKVGDYEYRISADENVVGLACYTGKETELEIPATIDGYEVKEVYTDMLFLSKYHAVKSIIVAEDNPYFTSIDGVLFSKDKTELVAYPPAKTGAYIVPKSVRVIGDGAFIGCSGLSSLIIQDGVKTIGDRAFVWCKNLASVIIPSSVTAIGVHAFHYCSGLTTITLPDSVTKIEDATFSSCDNLVTVILPRTIQSIGKDAFAYCRNLKTVIILNSQIEVADDAFFECNKLIPKATITEMQEERD